MGKQEQRVRARLTLLGSVKLERDGKPIVGKAAQRRRLGVLALLAAASDGSLSRERILSLVWPDQGPESARKLLSEAIYVLRKELGDQTIQSRGDALALDFSVVSCDVFEFRNAVAAGDWRLAATLYTGAFLDSWFLTENPEFERWADRERVAITTEYGRVLTQLIDDCVSANDLKAAAEWCGRLAELDPYASATALRFAELLARNGEPAAALRALRSHEQRLRDDLEVEPPADVVRRIELLRPTSRGFAAEQQPRAQPRQIAASPSSIAVAPGAQLSSIEVSSTRPRRSVWRLAIAGTAVVLLATLFWRQFGHADATIVSRRHRVAVLYFDDHSAEQDLGHLADGLTEEVINQLSGATAFDVVGRNAVKQFRGHTVPFDSIVALLGATIIVEGSVQKSDSLLRATVQLLDASSGSRVGGAEVERPISELFALERGVGRQIAEALRRQVGAEVTLRVISSGTRSSLARSLVLRAQREMDFALQLANRARDVDVSSATGAFERADTLLLAAHETDEAWATPQVMRGRVAIELASLKSGAERLAALERARTMAFAVLQRAPSNPEGMELDGLVAYMMQSESVDQSSDHARDSALLAHAERRLRDAVRLDPSLASAWATLSHVLWRKGQFAEADATARRALQEDAYLVHARDVYEQAFFASLAQGEMDIAADWCRRGGAAFPSDVALVQCELTLLSRRRDAGVPDTARAWALVRQLDGMESPAKASAMGREYSPVYRRMVAAIVSAVAGDTARARKVLREAQTAVRTKRVRSVDLGYDEAHLLLALGDTVAAASRLRMLMSERPSFTTYLRHDPVFAAIGPLLSGKEGEPIAK